jgi:hypothetical protein
VQAWELSFAIWHGIGLSPPWPADVRLVPVEFSRSGPPLKVRS